MEESKGKEHDSKANEEDKRKSGCIEDVEKRIEAGAQVESNRKWISRHMLVASEVLG